MCRQHAFCTHLPHPLIMHSTLNPDTLNRPDLVASLHSDPLRNGPVLLLLLGEEALDPESLVGRLETTKSTINTLSTDIYIQTQCLHHLTSMSEAFTQLKRVS